MRFCYGLLLLGWGIGVGFGQYGRFLFTVIIGADVLLSPSCSIGLFLLLGSTCGSSKAGGRFPIGAILLKGTILAL